MNRPWHYYLLIDGIRVGDREAAIARGDHTVRLARVPPSRESPEQFLHPDGTWHRGEKFYEERYRGTTYLDFVPISHQLAREVIELWAVAGRIPSADVFDARVPDEVEAYHAARDAEDVAEAMLRTDALTAEEADDLRRDVLTPDGENLSVAWRSVPGRTVAAVPHLFWYEPRDAEKLAHAFRAAAVTTVLGLSVTLPPPRSRAARTHPPGLRAPVDGESLRTLARVYVLAPRLFSAADQSCVLLDRGEDWLVAGPEDFVTALI